LSRTAEGTSQAFKGAGFGIVEFLRSLANMPGGGKGIFGWVSSILGIFSSAAGVFGGGIPDLERKRSGLASSSVITGPFIATRIKSKLAPASAVHFESRTYFNTTAGMNRGRSRDAFSVLGLTQFRFKAILKNSKANNAE
jgi:hypothetical protein